MKHRDGLSPPLCLNGQTVAIVSTVLTVGLGIGAMVFTSTSNIRGELGGIRSEIGGIRGEIGGIHGELGGIRGEIDSLAKDLDATRKSLSAEIKAMRVELRAGIKGLDGRLRVVEQAVAAIQGRLGITQPGVQGASPTGREADDADA